MMFRQKNALLKRRNAELEATVTTTSKQLEIEVMKRKQYADEVNQLRQANAALEERIKQCQTI